MEISVRKDLGSVQGLVWTRDSPWKQTTEQEAENVI